MKRSVEYTEIETPSISFEKKQHKMKEIYKILEEAGAKSIDTAKTSKEVNSKLTKEPIVNDINNKKVKKTQLNTPSFVGSLAGVMSKFGILGKVHRVEKVEAKWYIKGNIKMLDNIKPQDL